VAERWLYRSMAQAEDGWPLLGRSGSRLGVRIPPQPDPDMPVTWGRIDPLTGGMSVTVDNPELLESHRRPEWLSGGTATHPLFRIAESALALGLKLVISEPPLGHGEVQPARSMSIQLYEALLRETRQRWERILGP